MMSQTSGRTTGFSRLINEKTMILDTKPVDGAVKRLCPLLPSENEVTLLKEHQRLLEKFVKELVQKMRSNTFHMLFDEPLFLTNPDDIVWYPDEQREENVTDNAIEILLGIRRPPGTKTDQSNHGYVAVNLQQAPRFEDSQTPDIFEHVRSSNGKRLSPRGVCRVQHRIMQLTLRTLESKYNGVIRIDELSHPDKENSMRLRVAISQGYYERQQEEDQEDLKSRRKSRASQKNSKAGDNDDEDDDDDDDDDNEDEDEDQPKPALNSRMATVVEEETVAEEEFKDFNIRFFTGMNHLSKERIYLIARPYPFDLYSYKDDYWRFFYRIRENQLLRPVFNADQYRRLQAMAGLVRMCSVDPDLSWVSEGHLRHLILHLIQTEVDSGDKWQRRSLVQCIREMLLGLKVACNENDLSHYFVDKLNLVQYLDVGQRSRSCVRFSVLTKSDSAMIRAVDKYFDSFIQTDASTERTDSTITSTSSEVKAEIDD